MRRYTVYALNQELAQLLAGRYPAIEVEGEVAQVQERGHAYLVLRDAGDRWRRQSAQLACVCWADTWRNLAHRPEAGDRVVCRGKIGVYVDRGVYQLYITDIQPAGRGDLQEKIAQRIARLQADGLLDPARKRRLPPFPRVVGVATSPTGAALQDFLKVSRERFPATRILLAPCVVQGDRAAPSVLRAVELLLQDGRAEVIVVTRGGGSKEDLLPFQDEQLARFLAASPVPVVSAVGHQVDTTIADLVADAVAPTPSAAALLVLPDGPALRQRVDEADARLERAARRVIRRGQERVVALERRLRHPSERLAEVDRRARDLERRLREALGRVLARRAERLASTEKHLEALSPLSVLGRGYAIVHGPAGVVTAPTQVTEGDPLRIRVAEGVFGAVTGGPGESAE